MVASSDAEANSSGKVGCHDTQFTVRAWPEKTMMGRSCLRCQRYTFESIAKRLIRRAFDAGRCFTFATTGNEFFVGSAEGRMIDVVPLRHTLVFPKKLLVLQIPEMYALDQRESRSSSLCSVLSRSHLCGNVQ